MAHGLQSTACTQPLWVRVRLKWLDPSCAAWACIGSLGAPTTLPLLVNKRMWRRSDHGVRFCICMSAVGSSEGSVSACGRGGAASALLLRLDRSSQRPPCSGMQRKTKGVRLCICMSAVGSREGSVSACGLGGAASALLLREGKSSQAPICDGMLPGGRPTEGIGRSRGSSRPLPAMGSAMHARQLAVRCAGVCRARQRLKGSMA